MAEQRVQRRLAAILAADIVGYSKLMREDEAGTLAGFRSLRADLLDPKIAEYGGRLFKTMGDGLLVEFPSAVDAVQCAAEVQETLNARPHPPLRLRIGVNVGDVVVEDGDLFGDGVNLAARLEGVAPPGGVCISASAHEQVRHKLALSFEDIGPQNLKNIAEPVRAFALAAGPPRPAVRPSKPARRRTAASIAALIALALAVWAVASQYPDVRRDGAENLASERRLTIAVLPFTTPDDAAETWLGEGVAEDVMTELSRFRDLGVIARNSSFRYGGADTDIEGLRKDLGVDFALQGSVRRLGDQVRISLQLVDARTGANRWAERYDRPFADIVSIEEDVASQIAVRLVDEARGGAAARAARRAPGNLEAYELELRARAGYYAFTRDGAFSSSELVDRALALDPDLAAAWDLRSRLLIQFYVQPYDARRGDPALIEDAVATGKRAVEIDPDYSTGRATLGAALMWAGQFDAALGELRRAIALNPNDVSAVNVYADVLARAGRHRDSIDAYDLSERLDPHVSHFNRGLMGRTYVLMGEYARARDLTGACIEQAPKLFPCLLFHAAALSGLGEDAAARGIAERILAINPRFTVGGYQAIVRFAEEADSARMRDLLLAAGLPG